ncbi:uncharacterized protein LOC128869850 [Anastrepha ludens]|uniref:uncharacterized protein LOC128869850 n=1 Tax=Anastrepha ludens TaxID=28586 RepID=UPI0023B0894F|nr:uncharacterized protein LOC128869850 [Anastrepha ludens]
MPKIVNLRVEQLKTLLREREKPTTGSKAELVQRLCDFENSDEINMDERCTMPEQINELREMMQGITTLLQQQSREQRPSVEQTAASVETATTPVSMVDSSSARCSVKEIAETLPTFDPTNELSLPVEKFVERVNQAHSAYQWNERSLMLAVFSKLKGVAKLWLDASPECYSNWTIFAERLIEEFGTKPNEAEIHYKMNSSVRKFDEKVVEYCFRMSAIGQRYNLSESAIIKYTRNGLRNRELQTAIAPMRFDSMRHLRETLDEYDKNRNSTPGLKFEQNKNRNTNNDGNKGSAENKSKIKCYNCFEEGHIATRCSKPLRKAQYGDGQKVDPKVEAVERNKRNSTMTNRKVECDEEFCIKLVYVKNQAIKAFVDTGSECSMIRKSCADKFEIETEPCVLKIKGICGGARYASELMKTEIKIDSVKVNVILYIVDDELLTSDVLLGKEIFNRNIVAHINSGQLKFEYLPIAENRETTVSERKVINKNQIICGELESAQGGKLFRLLNEYNDIFANNISEIGQTNALSMKIKLDTNVPIAQNPYRIPEPKKVLVQQMIRELLVNDIIEMSESEYASPIVLVKKKNGESRL